MKKNRYDVVVCGAGVAGIAAAIAAARQGMKTALLEKQCLLGGLATSGLIYVFLPLCDGYGKQCIGGITEEMIRRCVEYGPFDLPSNWGGPDHAYTGLQSDRFQCCFSPAGFSLTLDKMLAEAGVDLWLDTVVVDARARDGHVSSIKVYNASGLQLIHAGCFVDATGSGCVAEMAGCAICHDINYATPWFMEMAKDASGFPMTGHLHVGCCGAWTSEFSVGTDTSGKATTQLVRNCWNQIRQRYDELAPGEIKETYPVHLAAMPQFRKIGAIQGLYHLTDADRGSHFDDAIGIGTDWRKPAPVWEVPYRALVPPELDNLLAAGRCIAAAEDAWEVLRVIPNAAMTGEAAGTAAALAIRTLTDVRRLEVKQLQRLLRGVMTA